MGGNDVRLGVPHIVLWNPIFPRNLEEKGNRLIHFIKQTRPEKTGSENMRKLSCKYRRGHL